METLFRKGRKKRGFIAEPMEIRCNTKDFASMIQLFRSLTEKLNFSQPFSVVVEYDPKQPRVKIRLYEPKEALQQYIQRVLGGVKD